MSIGPIARAPATSGPPPAPPAEAEPCRRFVDILGAETRPAPAALPAGPLAPKPPAAAAPAPSSAVGSAARDTLARLFSEEKAVDRGLAEAMSGRLFTPQQLIALQLQVVRYSQELDVVSRLVEKGTSAVKQALSTQV